MASPAGTVAVTALDRRRYSTLTARPEPVPQSAAHVEQLLREGVKRLAELAPEVGVEKETLYRWCARGKGGLKLEAVRGIGKGYRTSLAAVARFLAAVGARG